MLYNTGYGDQGYQRRHPMSEEDYDVMYNTCADYDAEPSVGHQRHHAGQRNNSMVQQQHSRRNKAQHVSFQKQHNRERLVPSSCI